MTQKPSYDDLLRRIAALEARENARRAEADRLESILSSLNTGLSLINPDNTIAWVNSKIRSIFPEGDPVGKVCHLFYEGSRVPCVPCPTRECFATGRVCEAEKFNPADDRWYHIISQPVTDADGKVVQVLEGVTDITSTRQAEENIRFQARLLGAVGQAVIATDVNGRITYMNPAAARLYGWSADEALGRPVIAVTPTNATKKQAKEIMNRLAQGEEWSGEFMVRHKNGREFPIYITDTPVLDDQGTLVGVIGVSYEISERKGAEKAMETLLDRLNLATRAARLGIWDWDIRKNELIWDDGMYALYGVKKGDFPGVYEAWLNGVHPDDRALSDHVSRQARSGEGEYDTEFRIIRPDGAVRTLKACGQVIRDAEGEPIRMTGVNFDITDQKAAEAQIRSALREKDVMLREIHHRVKNNLMVVKSLIEMQGEQTRDPAALSLFRDLRSRVTAMSMVHEDLYQSEDLSRIDFASYLERLTAEIRRGFAQTTVDIRISAENIFLDVGKAIPCGLIAAELTVNALKYAFAAPGDPARPDDAQRRPEIRIGMRKTGETYSLTVADNGRGLPEEIDLEKPKTLGLRLVRSWAARQLKGRVAATSGAGAAFTVTFRETRYA